MPNKAPETIVTCTITEATLNKSLALPWSTTTCIAALALPHPPDVCGIGSAGSGRLLMTWSDTPGTRIQRLYDRARAGGDNFEALTQIRAVLPVEFDVWVTELAEDKGV